MLTRLMWLSIAAALATIALKTLAWRLTGSVGLLSDAAESSVNLLAAVAGLVLLRWASSPPDRHHPYGHEKAEYFSAGLEGGLILVAAAVIAVSAAQRLLHPQPLHTVGPGLAASALAALLNLAVGLVMVREGRRLRSIVVEADGRHLLTDVWTSVGVIAGVGAVALTG
jgi:cation diffusion facilitator family transporter